MNAMNMQSAPSISSMLAQVATVVKIKSTSLGLKRQDKDAARQAEYSHHAAAGISNLNVSRLAGAGEQRVKDIATFVNSLKAEVFMRSTDFNGDRLVNNTILHEVLGVWHNGKIVYDQMVSDLARDAGALIAEAEAKKGDFQIEPPTEEEVRGAFSLTMEVSQIPDTSNYKAHGVTAELENEMRRRFDASTAAAYQMATQDALVRVAKPLAHLVDRMAVYSKETDEKERGVTSKGAGRLYETTITNVQDIAKVFRSFNVLGDPIMDKLAVALDEFNDIGIDDLKSSQHNRDVVADKAKAILNSLKDLI